MLTHARLSVLPAKVPGVLFSAVAMASVFCGFAVSVSEKVGVLAVLLLIAAGILASTITKIDRIFVALTGFLLIGYAILGKGFAYLGVNPVYVSEMVLFVAALALVVNAGRIRFTALSTLLILFMLLGLARTAPFLGRYQIDALRDAVLWAYAVYAVALVTVIRRVDVEKVIRVYGKLIPWFLAWVPIWAIAIGGSGTKLALVPGTQAGFAYFKGGDTAVQLCGVAAFLLLGMYGELQMAASTLWLWALWFVGFAAAGASNRGGLLAAMAGISAAFFVRPTFRAFRGIWIGALLFTVLLLAGSRLNVSGVRHLSANQLVNNVASIFVDQGSNALSATKEWRIEWWTKIVDYTFHGPYFWTGKGFGINLADSDGFQVTSDHSLRSPHNVHMTVLARMGVPGFVLWVALQLTFALSMLRAFFRARTVGDQFWMRVDIWLLAYWLAMMVNASFDVYLEGPQGGIWFWSVFGLGMAALRLQQPAVVPAARPRGYVLLTARQIPE